MKIIILICFLSISLLAQSKDSTSYKIYKKDFEQVIKERQEYDTEIQTNTKLLLCDLLLWIIEYFII